MDDVTDIKIESFSLVFFCQVHNAFVIRQHKEKTECTKRKKVDKASSENVFKVQYHSHLCIIL